MSMVANVAIDDVLSAVVARIQSTVVESVPMNPLTTAHPLRQAERFVGAEMTDAEFFRRGLAGRCPAVRVRFEDQRGLKSTLGKRTQKVETTIGIVAIDDTHEVKDRRQRLFAAMESVRTAVTARRYSLPIEGLRYRGTKKLRDDATMLSYLMTFATRHWSNYTIDPGADTLDSFQGDIVDASNTRSAIMHAPTVAVVGVPGTKTVSYGLFGLDAAGLRTLLSPLGTVATAPATLNGSNFCRVSWSAVPGCVSYELHRIATNGSPSSLGLIASTSLLTFDDTGIAATTATPPDHVHEPLEVIFP